MMAGPDAGRVIEARERHVEAVGRCELAEDERGPALRAEQALGARRGAIDRRLARGPGEISARHGEPRHDRRAAGTLAHPAMTVIGVMRHSVDPIAHPAAQATAFEG